MLTRAHKKFKEKKLVYVLLLLIFNIYLMNYASNKNENIKTSYQDYHFFISNQWQCMGLALFEDVEHWPKGIFSRVNSRYPFLHLSDE